MRNLNISAQGTNPANQSGQTTVQANQTANNNAGSGKQTVADATTKKMTKEDWTRLITSVIVATVVFWVAFIVFHFLITPNWAFWLVVVLSFAFSMLVLAAVDAAVITKSGLGTAITLFIILQAGLLLIGHYANTKSDAKDNDKIAEAPKAAPAPEVIDQVNASGVLMLLNTTHIFQLVDGEETPWFGGPENKVIDYTIASSTYDYQVFLSDGTSYKGGESIPLKQHVYYKIKVKSAKFVTVTFKEKKG